MRGGIASIAVAVALTALLAPGLVACGGDDETTTSSSDDGAAARQGEQAGGKQAGADVEAAPLKVSGGGSGQFQVRGGDNSIQNWGEESEESQLEEAAAAVHAFYVARANEEWARACTYLARSTVEELRGQSEQGSLDCATRLEALTRHPLPSPLRRESTVVDAGSLRIGEDSSFLIYRGAGRTVFAMPLVEEDGAWKLTLISPTTLG